MSKKKRLQPGLGSLRSRRPRLPGGQAKPPITSAEPVDLEPVAHQVTQVEDAVQALGDRVDVMAKTVPPAPPDFSGEIQQVSDAVLALGDRVDGMARRQDEIP